MDMQETFLLIFDSYEPLIKIQWDFYQQLNAGVKNK